MVPRRGSYGTDAPYAPAAAKHGGPLVGAPLTLDLDPTPAVTVLIGRNGSGKSGTADAVETALHGEPRAPASTGRGG